MQKTAVWLILVVISLSSCRNRTIHIFISNESRQDSVIQMELYLNQQKQLHQSFRFTPAIPDYESFEFSTPGSSDSIILDIKTNTGVVKKNVKIAGNENYIFIAYSYWFVNDSVIKPRDLTVSSYKRMPWIE